MSNNKDIITAFNEECPVCFSEEGNMITLSCLHRFHEGCLQGHTNLKCPKCRQVVINWSCKLKETIEFNSIKFVNEMDEEDRNSIQTQETNAERMELLSNISMFLQPPPQLEIMTAFQYLQEEGIPMYYLPQKVLVSIKRGHPRPQPGVLFNAVISQTQERIMKDIYENSKNVEEDDQDDNNNEDEEDPFLEENYILEKVNRNFKVIFID
jgi:hypothetical protein